MWGNLDMELSVIKQWVIQLISHNRRWVVQSVGQDIAQGILAQDIATNKPTNLYITVINHINIRSLTATHCIKNMGIPISTLNEHSSTQ